MHHHISRPNSLSPLRCVLAAALLLTFAVPASAQVLESEVGTEAIGGERVEETLSGGFIKESIGWSHIYDAVPGTIVSATIQLDLIDADAGVMELHAGMDETGPMIGTAVGIDHGTPGPWRDLRSDPPDGSYDNEIAIGPEHFEDLADGSFDVFGLNLGMKIYGSNSALLTIEYSTLTDAVVDIRPFSKRNRVNPEGRGAVLVAIYGSEELVTEEIDTATLGFGPNAAPPLFWPPPMLKDLDKDGLLDMLALFRIAETGIAAGTVEACLDGEMMDGSVFEGCDAVDTTPPDFRKLMEFLARLRQRWHAHR